MRQQRVSSQHSRSPDGDACLCAHTCLQGCSTVVPAAAMQGQGTPDTRLHVSARGVLQGGQQQRQQTQQHTVSVSACCKLAARRSVTAATIPARVLPATRPDACHTRPQDLLVHVHSRGSHALNFQRLPGCLFDAVLCCAVRAARLQPTSHYPPSPVRLITSHSSTVSVGVAVRGPSSQCCGSAVSSSASAVASSTALTNEPAHSTAQRGTCRGWTAELWLP